MADAPGHSAGRNGAEDLLGVLSHQPGQFHHKKYAHSKDLIEIFLIVPFFLTQLLWLVRYCRLKLGMNGAGGCDFIILLLSSIF